MAEILLYYHSSCQSQSWQFDGKPLNPKLAGVLISHINLGLVPGEVKNYRDPVTNLVVYTIKVDESVLGRFEYALNS